MMRGTGVVCVANASTSSAVAPTLYTRTMANPEGVPGSYTNTSVALMKGSGISLFGDYVFIQKSTGAIVRRHLDTSAETAYLTVASAVGLAAVSATDLYVLQKLSDTTYKLGVYNTSGLIYEWSGAVYGERVIPGVLDAERISGIDYIVYQTELGRNAKIIKRNGAIWSDSENIFPIDIVDDTSQFRLGGASTINGKLVVVGMITRSGYHMKVYTIGPEHFSSGREMFVVEGQLMNYILNIGGINESVPGSPGKMLAYNDRLYIYGGDGLYHRANSTVLFGSDRTDQKTTFDILGASFSSESNRPAQITMDLPSFENDNAGIALLKAGNLLEWYAEINGVSAKLGTFSIDIAPNSQDEKGRQLSVVARSLGGKYLSTWNSDASYDYWSQAKQSSQVTELTEVIRGSGTWEDGLGDDSFITLRDFNEAGVLYTIERSARNGVSVGEFKITTLAGYDTKYGVAIAYHRETPQDAAARLGTEVASNANCYNHGFFFVLNSAGTPKLYSVLNNTWTELASGSTVPDRLDWHWLRIQFSDGYIRCDYRTGTNWVNAISHRFISDAGNPLPWFADEVGKAAIYVENVTAHANSYAFGSEDSVLPVDDNSSFPSDDIVQVDSEKIRYDGKSPNYTLGPLDWVDGRTFKDAPHDNEQTFPLITMAAYDGTATSWGASFLYAVRAQSFVSTDYWELCEIEIYVDKVGSPPSLTVQVGTDDCDNGGLPPSSSILASATVPAGPSGAQWLLVSFSTPIKLQPDQAYFIMVRDTAQTETDYYAIGSIANIGVSRHLYRRCTSSGVWDTVDRTMNFRVRGRGSLLPGHEIYFDTSGAAIDPVYYNDCALIITEGKGIGRAFKVTGYDHVAPYQWVPVSDPPPSGWENFVGDEQQGSWVDADYRRVFVEEDISGLFDLGTKAMIVPSLLISQRGIEVSDAGVESVVDTTNTSHPASICSVYKHAFIGVRTFEYFSNEQDWRLEDMIREICAKANVFDLNCEQRISSAGTGSGATLNFSGALTNSIEGESAIVKFSVSNWDSGGGVGLAVFPPTSGTYSTLDTVGVLVRQNQIEFYGEGATTPVIYQTYPLPQNISGDFTISFQRRNFSIWNNGRFICHFDWPDSHAEESTLHVGFKIGVLTSKSVVYSVDWSALDIRVDNFILDIGQSGLSLLNSLIGEKRVFIVDDVNGIPRMFRTRQTVNEGSPMTLEISGSTVTQDLEVRTRLRVEGAEIVEKADFSALAAYGNRFAMIGLREPNNIIEAMREAQFIQDDALRSYTQIPFTGAADPRVEPQDIIEVTFPAGDKSILVSSVGFLIQSGDKEAVFDMSIDGEAYG
jgi:hypothetical protein